MTKKYSYFIIKMLTVTFPICQINDDYGKKPGLVVKADGSRSRGREFEPRHRILDGCKRC